MDREAVVLPTDHRVAGAGVAITLALRVAVVATIAAFDRVDRRAAALLVPYLAWVTLAAVLIAAIWRLSG